MRKDGGLRRSGHAAVEACHKPKVQDDIQAGRNRQKHKRSHGISQRTQQRSKKVVQKDAGHSDKNHREVLPRHPHQMIRRTQHRNRPVQASKGQNMQEYRDGGKQGEGSQNPFLQPVFILPPIIDGKNRAAAHGKPQ